MKRKVLSLLLCLSLLVSVVVPVNFANAADGETSKITINYVYEKNGSMVAQPYSATVSKTEPFHKEIAIPKLLNYSIDAESVAALPAGFSLDTEKGIISVELETVPTDISIALYYVAGTAKYYVHHMVEKLGSNEFEQEGQTIELTGDIDAYTEAVAKQKHGFVSRVEKAPIAADGTTEVNVWYDRLSYTVVFDPNGGVNAPESIYAEYGTAISAEYVTAPTRKGYNFKGWSPEVVYEVTDNVTYVAQWESISENADYTIVIWGQNANDDDYSYLNSYPAWGNVGKEITWNESTFICKGGHEHKPSCYELICGKGEHSHAESGCSQNCGKTEHTHGPNCCTVTEHTHNAMCQPLDCKHQHDLSCWGLSESDQVNKPPEITEQNPVSGKVYTFETEVLTFKITHYYLFLNGAWYCHHGLLGNSRDDKSIVLNCAHSHDATCYKQCLIAEHTHGDGNCVYCNLEEHTHDTSCWSCKQEEHTHIPYGEPDSCYKLNCGFADAGHTHDNSCYMGSLHPDRDLWKYVKSDTVTIAADGSTVLNVYFDRNEFTLNFNYDYSGRQYNTNKSITARWGADIADEYNAIVAEAGGSFWSRNENADGPYTNYIGIMPTENRVYYYRNKSSGNKTTMTYYAQDLNGNDEVIFTLSFYGDNYSVTEEDFYEFEGYTFNPNRSSKRGDDCNGAKFYYDRNSYNLNFFNGSNSKPEKTEQVKYQAPLASYGDYEPATRPDTVESDAVFVGWYLNPECTGVQYDFDSHNMPANDLALYAKWSPALYTVKTFTDETMTNLYTYTDYNGIQENIVKYTKASEPVNPTKQGEVFVGWFYKDGETEKPFSFTMPITRNYDLYPKFSDKAPVTYTVHYYIESTVTKVADDMTGTAIIGSTVTEKAKMGSELNLANGILYFPVKTSTSIVLDHENQEIIFYYRPAEKLRYTVRYVDNKGNRIHEDEIKETDKSYVTETYIDIPNYTPQKFTMSIDISADETKNIITFVYDPNNTTLMIDKNYPEGANYSIDKNQTFLFRITGNEVDLIVTVHGNGETTIADLPVGTYTVKEITEWSWRYGPDELEKTITLNPNGNNTVTFTNTRNEALWLDGDNYKVNQFAGVSE